MGKARKIGIKSTFTPNAKADMRFKRNIYQRGREIAGRDPHESRAARRETKQHQKYERQKQQEA